MNTVREPQLPKYWQLAEHFRQQIRRGELRPGDRLPSLVEMRTQQGVSRATMDKVHSILEQEGLTERRQGYGTFVMDREKPVRRGTIGLYGWGFLEGRSSSYWMELLDGIHNSVGLAGSQLLLFKGKVGTGWEKVDGVILSTNEGDSDTLSYIPSQLPVVCLFDSRTKRASVAADEYSGMKLAVEHLIQLGHRRIAYLHGRHQFLVEQRMSGYHDALKAAGLKPRPNWLRELGGKNDYGTQFTDAGRREMKKWLEESGRNGWKKTGCTALLCHNDETAVGAMQSLQAAGLRVPQDVSVVGFDGLQIGECCSPRLTTVEMPLRELGKAATRLLQDQIASDAISTRHEVLATRLLVRLSTGAPAVALL